MRWLLDNVESVKSAHDEGNVIFATIDTWLIYVSFIIFILQKLTSGKNILTDSSNASRTMLMDINTL